MSKYIIALFVTAMMLASCSSGERHYIIGVSQCSEDIWREKQNAELRMGSYFHDNVELRFAAAYDSDERQIEQIDSLLAVGIDLLIVAPNQVQTITPAIDRAYDQGIPVIVFERKTSSQKFTAFMSADNYEMGHVMGDYIASRLKGQGSIMEIKGLEGSSPAIDRHNGFIDALNDAPGIQVNATLQGDWTEPTAYHTVSCWLSDHRDVPIDLVFGMNDRTATGARQAFIEAGRPLPLFCGIDGLPGNDGGICLVRDSVLEASYIYPTHGDQLLQLAVDILEGKPYQKETKMMSALVTHDNARVLLMQSEEIMRQAAHLDSLHQKADNYLKQLDNQRTITLLAFIVIGLLLVVIALTYLYHHGRITLRRERVVNNLWNLTPTVLPATEAPEPDKADVPDDTPVASQEHEPPADAEPLGSGADNEKGSVAETIFITRFKDVVEQHLPDSSLSVEDLASAMNLSRVQLYRKVKAISGSSPVELLRSARLNRGYQLLLTTDKTVSEIAYLVGFTAPSYFTKCFKEEFGRSPSEVQTA